MSFRVVILDDEPNMRKILVRHMALEGFKAEAFESPKEALKAIQSEDVAVLLSDLRMPEMTGEEVLEAAKASGARCEVILMTGYGTVESAMRCVRNGAYDYITKPFDTKALLATVKRAAAQFAKLGTAQVEAPTVEEDQLSDKIIGHSKEIQTVRALIARVAPSDSSVLVVGESGTGKELVAQAIHRLSTRFQGRFMAVNCASIPETLMESELFGHVRGAFTGAVEDKVGVIETSSGGTLFLDEIGELPIHLQAKLLRTLQEREITPVGGVEPLSVDLRVVAATNRLLEVAVKEGQFREDLYYRLNVLKVKLPPLRERIGDIPLLANFFLHQLVPDGKGASRAFGPCLMDKLQELEWPGNIRELRNVVERLVVLCDDEVIEAGALTDIPAFESQIMQAPLKMDLPESTGKSEEEVREYREARNQFEKKYLEDVLQLVGGNVSEAATRAGISRRSFYEKIEKYRLDLTRFK